MSASMESETASVTINPTLLSEGYSCGRHACMAFTDDDMKTLRLLLREELQAEVRPFRRDVGKRFDEVATQWMVSISKINTINSALWL